MNKPQMIDLISGMSGIALGDARRILKALEVVAVAELQDGREVILPGIGRVRPVDVSARKGRNPKTGESIDIPARRSVRLSIARSLKTALNP